MKKTMAMRIMMKTERMSKMRMMNMEKKKMKIWMKGGKMIWIIVKLCMEMRMMMKIYNNLKISINNMKIWKKEEKMNKIFHKRKKMLSKLRMRSSIKSFQIKGYKMKLKKTKKISNKTICRKNILILYNSSFNRKIKS